MQEPFPALKNILSSNTLIAASTASNADLLSERAEYPELSEVSSAFFIYSSYSAGWMSGMFPQPPWITIPNFDFTFYFSIK